jgi:hypothetical protein
MKRGQTWEIILNVDNFKKKLVQKGMEEANSFQKDS